MKLTHRVIRVLIFSVLLPGTASAQLEPPPQDYYLHLEKTADRGLEAQQSSFASTDVPGKLTVSDALTVETWILWAGNNLEEIKSVSGLDTDVMTILCGQRAYGFQRRLDGAAGWSFFLATDAEIYPETGEIPVPLNEWAHLAATYDGATIKTYLNGVLQNEIGGVSGSIKSEGNFDFRAQCNRPLTGGYEESLVFAIGTGDGFHGGIRQLRIWDRALSAAELLANAEVHLDGTESGLVGYWKFDGPPNPPQIPNEVAGSPPLKPGFDNELQKPLWRKTDPLFVVREDLAEDILLTDCPSFPIDFGAIKSWLVDVQNDGDLDLIFTGSTGECGEGSTPFRALIRDGANGFVFDTAAAIAGTVPTASNPWLSDAADFNGDGRLDIFSCNQGEDYCTAIGAPNTLLLSRPDGLLEDASGNLLGPPCNAVTPQFEGQHPCYLGGDFGDQEPGVRYPGAGDAVVPEPDPSGSCAIGDTDGDGDMDILVGNWKFHHLQPPYLLINNGQGEFLANWQLLPDFIFDLNNINYGSSLGTLLADMDGDGHIDLVMAPAWNDGAQEWSGSIFWNDGNGDFSSAERLIVVPTPGIPPNDIITGLPRSEGGMVVADIDMDGDNDLLVSWIPEDFRDPQFASSLQVLVNHGGRVFVDETVARVGVPPQAGMPRDLVSQFHAEDFNADGCPDLLFPHGGFLRQDAGIWFNDCNGNFSPADQTVLPKRGGSTIPFDYDGDGDTDLIIAILSQMFFAGTAGCGTNEGVDGADYIDFAVLLNQSPPDTDGDRVADIHDLFPDDPDEWFDADTDGIGDNADLDDDNDQIPDSWEIANGLNLRDASDAELDSDGDSLSNINEFKAGTDPRDADTDDDQMPDAFEIANGLDPLDPADALADQDGDGFSNLAEFLAGTDINDPQSNPGEIAAAIIVILKLLLDDDL